jgi:head-tail adaptor
MTIMQPPKQKATQPAIPPFQLFDQRITIVDRSETSDGYGGLGPTTETVIASGWAAIEKTFKTPSPRLGSEHYQAGTVEATAMWKITFWYDPNVTVKHFIRHGTRLFNILMLENVEDQNLYYETYCSERVEPSNV